VRRYAAIALGLGLLLSSCTAERPALQIWRGNALFRRGEDSLALLRYFQALDHPAGERWDAWILYDIGSAYVSLGELEPGARVLDEVVQDLSERTAPEGPAPETGSRWYRELEFRLRFNRAVAAYERGAFAEAARGFATALRIRPDSWEAKVNLELSLAERSSRPAAGVQRQSSQESPEVGPESRRLLEQIEKEERPAWQTDPQPREYAEDW
jgi:tetratricopeptide (TPR) repeat protein